MEVVQTQGRLKIHVECEKRSGLLVDIMEVLESSGLNVEQASITCQEHLVFDGVGSEVLRIAHLAVILELLIITCLVSRQRDHISNVLDKYTLKHLAVTSRHTDYIVRR